MLDNASHFWNTLSPMLVTVFGRDIVVITIQE